MIEYILYFTLFWIIANIVHELGHYLSAKNQGANPRIELWSWNGIPSMMTVYDGELTHRKLFLFAGGAWSGIFMASIAIWSLVFNLIPIYRVSVIISIIEIFYAMYEMKFRDSLSLKNYMMYHYFVYLLGFITGCIYLVLTM